MENMFASSGPNMTLRDTFAAHALVAFGREPQGSAEAKEIAERAYMVAEAMVEARRECQKAAWLRYASWLDDRAKKYRDTAGDTTALHAREHAEEIRKTLDRGDLPRIQPKRRQRT
jgi:hypothetical protein